MACALCTDCFSNLSCLTRAPCTEEHFKSLAVPVNWKLSPQGVDNNLNPKLLLVCCCLTLQVTLWLLALGGAGLVIGLATYGYNIMRVLGVKCTHITPSR